MLCIHVTISKYAKEGGGSGKEVFLNSICFLPFSRYLNANGKLQTACNEDCLFSAEYHGGHLALRDR